MPSVLLCGWSAVRPGQPRRATVRVDILQWINYTFAFVDTDAYDALVRLMTRSDKLPDWLCALLPKTRDKSLLKRRPVICVAVPHFAQFGCFSRFFSQSFTSSIGWCMFMGYCSREPSVCAKMLFCEIKESWNHFIKSRKWWTGACSRCDFLNLFYLWFRCLPF